MGGGNLTSSLIKMKRKGFTLIELLAVIVIIAVIALITIPIVVNVVENAQRNAFIDSAYGIIEAGKLYYMENMTGKDIAERYDFSVSDNKFVLDSNKEEQLKFTGKMPKTGMLQIYPNGKEAIGICTDKYCACKSVSELKVTIKNSNCNINSETGEIEEEKGVDATPSGTVISYMGKIVPDGYLSCDGKTYNINDYPFLAEQIKKNFGSYNYFGGDGTTTFAVPDLRGEFLRGTGTATRNTGSGAEAGVHQNPTRHLSIINYNGVIQVKLGDTSSAGAGDADSWIFGPRATNIYATDTFSEPVENFYTSRPTNTSVLYCIKY